MTKDGRFVAWSVATVVLVAQLVAPPVAEAAPAATDGALTSGDWLIPNQGNGGYDVEHYDVDLEFFPDPHAAPGTVVEDCSDESGNGPGSIKATTTVHATTTSLLRSFGLDFKGLTVTRVTVDGVAAQFSRVQDAAADKFKLVVTPAAPVTGDFEVAVAYEGVPETYQFDAGFDMGQGWMKTWDYCGEGGDHFSDGGATGIGQPAGGFTWFPNNTTPTDKATYTIRLTGPSEYTGLSVGVLTDESALAGGRTSWTWDVTVPTTTFLVFVSFGAYDVRTSTVELLDGSTIPQWSVGHDFMKDEVAYDIDDLDGLVGEVIRWHEARFGPYQPTSAGYLLAPLMSGWALETVGRPVFTWAMNEIVVVHEYAHQWAGDSVSVTDWSDLWLAEGFATYAEWLWEGDHGGAGPLEVGRSLLTSSPLHAHWKQRVAAPTRAELWGWGSYDGGGLALAALQAGVGDDAFFRIMRTWFDRYANSNASTWDFIALAEEVSGRELTAWADDYLFSDKQPTWPTLQTYPAAVADDCGGTALTTCALEDRVGRSATLGRVGDRDWFKLTPGRAGEYTITLDAQASADRLDLALLDSEGHEVPGAEAGIDAAGDLVLTWALAQGTDYFVAVTADPGASLDGPVAYTVTADVPESSFMEVLRRVLDRLRELIARLLTVFGVFPG